MILYDIMIYAICGLALAFGVGILTGMRVSLAPLAWLLAAAASFLCGLWLRRWKASLLWMCLLITALALGSFRTSRVETIPAWVTARVPLLSELTGTVASYPEIGLNELSFELTLEQLPARVLVYWRADDPLCIVHVGDQIQVSGAARLPEAFDGFDYPAYLARRGIVASFYAEELHTLSRSQRALVSLLAAGDRIRQRLLGRLRSAMPANQAALAQSLLFGDRTALDPDIEKAFSRTGLMHLLAVSGLHLGIFLGLAWWVLRRLGVRARFAYPSIAALVLLALWIIGPRVSLIRAGLLFAFLGLGHVLVDLGWILRRWIQPLNGLAAAAIAMLGLAPFSILDAGFQLTFAATGSILLAFHASGGWATHLLGDPGSTWKSRMLRPMARLLVVAIAAQAGVLPVIAWHFGAFHPFSVLLNLFAVPLAALSLWAGLISLILSWTIWLKWIVRPFGWLLEGLRLVVHTAAQLPGVEVEIQPTLALWLAGFVGFLYLVTAYGWLSSAEPWEPSLTSNSTSIVSGFRDRGTLPPRKK